MTVVTVLSVFHNPAMWSAGGDNWGFTCWCDWTADTDIKIRMPVTGGVLWVSRKAQARQHAGQRLHYCIGDDLPF